MSQRRLRARPMGITSPVTRRPLFRIEDETGRVLGRIGTARDAEEAMALFWRAAPLPGLQRPVLGLGTAENDIATENDALMAGRLPLPAADGETLPFAERDAARGSVPAASDEAEPAPRGHRKRRTPAPAQPRPQDDLFVAPAEAEPLPATPGTTDTPAPAHAAAGDDVPAAEAPVGEARAARLPPTDATADEAAATADPAAEQPVMLSPEMAMLRAVNPRDFRPTDRSDAYLYHITTRPDADAALEGGLPLSAADPVILTERGGVSYWLSVLSEDFDYILDQPPELVVLRLRRQAVQDLLEPDPSSSDDPRRATYLLTGGTNGARR